MGKLAEAYVDVRADLKGLDAGLGQAKGRLTSFVSSAGGILAGLGAGIGLAGVAAGLMDAAQAASDLNETVSKTRVVFKGSAGEILSQAQDLADRFGLVKQVTLDAASNFGLVTQASGLTADASAKLSNRLVKLAADASSFYNVGFDEALEKIRSALVGESEPIRAFGVLLSEDAVKAEALAMGLIKSTKEIDEQSKVMARASLIFKQMTAASGDLERTIDGAANQMRKFNGELENLKADFGQSLTGPLVEAIALAKELGATLSKATGGSGAESAGEAVGVQVSGAVGALRGINKGYQDGGVLGALSAAFTPDQAEFDKRAGVQVGMKGLVDKSKADQAKAAFDERDGQMNREFAARRAAMERGQAALQQRYWDKYGKPGSVTLTEAGKQNPQAAANLFGGMAAVGVLGNPLGLAGGMAAKGQTEAEKAEKARAAEETAKRMSTLSGITDSDSFDRMAREQALQTDGVAEKQLKEAEKQTEALGKAVGFLDEMAKAGGKKGGATLRGAS